MADTIGFKYLYEGLKQNNYWVDVRAGIYGDLDVIFWIEIKWKTTPIHKTERRFYQGT